MATAWVECWKCDLCGHRWIKSQGAVAPRLCSKCKRTNWNTESAAVSEARLADAPAVVHPTIKPAVSMDALRAICAGKVDALPEQPTQPAEPEQASKRCTYEEWSTDLGEMVQCGLSEHGLKVKHHMM
jgi:hypothetical protein